MVRGGRGQPYKHTLTSTTGHAHTVPPGPHYSKAQLLSPPPGPPPSTHARAHLHDTLPPSPPALSPGSEPPIEDVCLPEPLPSISAVTMADKLYVADFVTQFARMRGLLPISAAELEALLAGSKGVGGGWGREGKHWV